jgi:hypothetical protein
MKCNQINTYTHTKAAHANGCFILENPMLQIQFYRQANIKTLFVASGWSNPTRTLIPAKQLFNYGEPTARIREIPSNFGNT